MYVTHIGSASRPSEPRASEPTRGYSEPSRAIVVARSWLGSMPTLALSSNQLMFSCQGIGNGPGIVSFEILSYGIYFMKFSILMEFRQSNANVVVNPSN